MGRLPNVRFWTPQRYYLTDGRITVEGRRFERVEIFCATTVYY